MAGVGADQEFHGFQAIGLWLFAVHALQLDAETPAGHAQCLHFLLDGRGQALGGAAAQRAEFGGLLLVMTGVGGQFLGQAFAGLVVGIEALQFLEQSLLQGGQLGGLDAVLAGQGVDGVQAFFEVLLALRVGIEVIDEAVQFAHGLLDLDLRAGQQVARFAQRTALAAEGAKPVEAGGQRRQHVAGIAFAAQLEYLTTGTEQRFGIAQGLVFALQFVQFVFAQGQVFQFFQLVAEQLVAGALLITLAGNALQVVACLLPALCSQLHLARQLLAAGVLVEQAAVGVALEQRLVFMLAVDVDDQLAERLEVSLRAGAAVDVAARAPLGGDHPAQDARAVAVQVALGEPAAGFGDLRQIEAGEDVGLVRAGAHHAAVGTVAQAQAEGIEHDRLAGTGFAADGTHAGIQLEVQVVDDGVVVYGQVHQHGERSRI